MPKPAPKRASARPTRPVYHEPQPGGTSRGNRVRETVIRGEAQGLGPVAWVMIVLIALVLADMFAWDGYYAHQAWLSLNAGGTSARNWADNLWN